MNRAIHRWRQIRRMATAVSVVVALLFHITILFAPNSARADGLGNNVILCSSYGLYSVALADLNGDQVPDQVPEQGSEPAMSFFCPVCSAAHVPAMAVPSAETILPLPHAAGERVALARLEPGVSLLLIAGSGPRAPPAIV